MVKTKKARASGKFGARYGSRVREKFSDVEEKQRKKQICPYCKKKKLKRISKGIWQCRNKNCGKKFASDTYYLS